MGTSRRRLAVAFLKGLLAGVIFAAIELITPPRIPPGLLVLIYAVVVAFLAAGTATSIGEGLSLGLGAMAAHILGELTYYGTIWGIGIISYTGILMLAYLPCGLGGAYMSPRRIASAAKPKKSRASPTL